MTAATKSGIIIHEGGINLPENAKLKEKLLDLIKMPSARVIGGSFHSNMLWIGIDSIGICDHSFAKTILKGLGIESLVLNGVLYRLPERELPIA